jgi:glycosyltransferase involved in cell wall biosynthesis
MKRALIATLYNEADNLSRWWECLVRQTVLPDEIAVMDGGSKDGTWERLQELARTSPVPVKLKQVRCNIAAGRNHAIALTDAEIIVSTDAGSYPAPDWFAEITRPLLADAATDVVGGCSEPMVENEFQRRLLELDGPEPVPRTAAEIYPSSRNTAFRRTAWSAVGGYPEWLTLWAEDALFNFQLHALGKKYVYNPHARVRWPVRRDAKGYFQMLRNYGYGSAEARLYAPYFRRRLLIALCPPLVLFSRWRWRHAVFRYRKNFASASGWVAGRLRGRRAPENWRRLDGIWFSPEALAARKK